MKNNSALFIAAAAIAAILAVSIALGSMYEGEKEISHEQKDQGSKSEAVQDLDEIDQTTEQENH